MHCVKNKSSLSWRVIKGWGLKYLMLIVFSIGTTPRSRGIPITMMVHMKCSCRQIGYGYQNYHFITLYLLDNLLCTTMLELTIPGMLDGTFPIRLKACVRRLTLNFSRSTFKGALCSSDLGRIQVRSFKAFN